MMAAGIDRPRITTRLIASRSTAMLSAWRTRTSLNGFLPLTFEYSSSSRFWSMPRKMVRNSGPCITLLLPLALMRATSCSGTGSITSTWPESKAATRVDFYIELEY